jgi:hypothetical protein
MPRPYEIDTGAVQGRGMPCPHVDGGSWRDLGVGALDVGAFN